VASLWEIAIKAALGKLDIGMGLGEYADGFTSRGYQLNGVCPEHICALSSLPGIHKDPFDRLLVSQAKSEKMLLLTTDGTLVAYGSMVRLSKA
jgi:PIN domain nuclease of toxin-antitoxin system